MATIEQYKRFTASAPEGQREIRTIELSHPDFSQTYYFVSDYVDLVAQTETSATVTYQAAGMKIVEPAERNDSEQSLSVAMGAVTDELQDILDEVTEIGYMTEMKVTYRKYWSGDLTQPAVPPLILYGSNITFDNSESVSFTAEDTDLSNKRSGRIYTLTDYPGLATA